MPTVLVTGANRGLGLEFARQYAADGWDVIGTARGAAAELEATGARVETLDMGDLDAVAEFGARVDATLDLVIANAGIYGPASAATAADARGWQEVLTVNSIAPALLAQGLVGKVADGGKMVAISSMMGSIAQSGAGSIPYRSSKAALNMAWHVLALEHPGAIMAVLNPGWVKTDMGGAGASITPAESIGQMRKVIAGLTGDQSGGFFNRDGSPIAW